MLEDGRNVVLVGMPAVGKSTLGVLLAKALSMDFVDTDVAIQARECRRLQSIINENGLDNFRVIEERHLLMSEFHGAVVATGGSVVYSEDAMGYLREGGVVVHLDLPLEMLRTRLEDMDARGVAIAPGQTLDTLYAERMPLYKRYADIVVDCEGLGHDAAVSHIVDALGKEETD